MSWLSIMASWPSNASSVFAYESSSSSPDSLKSLSDAADDNDDDMDGTAVPPIPCSDDWFFFIIYGPLFAITCGFGLVGNCLSFCVLHRYSSHSGNVSTFLLRALAVSDNVFLSVAAFVQMYPAMAVFLGATDHLKTIYPKYQMLAWPLAHMVQLGTVWVMVLVASTRYVAVCHPLHAQRLCTKRNVSVQIALIAVFSVVYNIPRFVEYRYVEVNVTDIRDNTTLVHELNLGLASHPVYNIVYENIAYCLFAFLLPLTIVIFFNTHLLRELKRSQRLRKALRKGKPTTSDENNVTLVMVVIIISFILCQTPASANQVLFYVIDEASRTTCSAYMMYYHLCNLLITISSALNFIIYCLFRRQFQQQLRAMMGCRTSPQRGVLRCSDITRERGFRPHSDLTQLTSSEIHRKNVVMSVSRSVANADGYMTKVDELG